MIRNFSYNPTLAAVSFVLTVAFATNHGLADDTSLPSWNDGGAKKAILEFVRATTTKGTDSFVPAKDRIAVFDNDGTLWCENPIPFQLLFAIDELKRLAPEHPEWNDNVAVQAAISGDIETLKRDLKKSLMEIMAVTHAGMTTDEFDDRVRDWIATAKHPRFNRPYNQLVFQPMLELLTYLRENDYRTYIVSGGGADFMRVWAEETYRIPPEQTIGSIGAVKFEMRDGKPVLVKLPELTFVDDREGKPIAIHRYIGHRPIAAFGNSDGDEAMLQYTTIGQTPSFGLIVHHTDAEREYAYDTNPKSSGKLDKALNNAPSCGWVVVDMAKDWKKVFPDLESKQTASLEDTSWLVEDIENRGVIDRVQTTITFGEDNMVSGRAAANRYTGKATIDGDAIEFGPLATTRRMGPPAVMDQEQKFLATVAKAKRFEIDERGLLFLLDAEGNKLIRASKMDAP